MAEQKTVYFGAGWFSDVQNRAYKDAMDALAANPTVAVHLSYGKPLGPWQGNRA